MTPAEELRTATATLRKHIAAVNQDIATNRYWAADSFPANDYPFLYGKGVAGGLGGPAGSYAATMGLGLGTALARLLDDCADLHQPRHHDGMVDGCRCGAGDSPCSDLRNALHIARTINANQPEKP